MLVAVVVSAARYDSAWNSADDSPPYSASLELAVEPEAAQVVVALPELFAVEAAGAAVPLTQTKCSWFQTF